MTSVTINEAKKQLSQLIERAERGEEVIITRDNKPVARLVACLQERPKRGFGSMGEGMARREFLGTPARGGAEALGGWLARPAARYAPDVDPGACSERPSTGEQAYATLSGLYLMRCG